MISSPSSSTSFRPHLLHRPRLLHRLGTSGAGPVSSRRLAAQRVAEPCALVGPAFSCPSILQFESANPSQFVFDFLHGLTVDDVAVLVSHCSRLFRRWRIHRNRRVLTLTHFRCVRAITSSRPLNINAVPINDHLKTGCHPQRDFLFNF